MKQYKIIREVTLKLKKGERVENYTMSKPENVFEFLKDKIADEAQENLIALYLDNRNTINCWALISKGTINETIVHPREIFKYAYISNSASVIIAHNHPSGNLTPSAQDIKTTRRMREAGEILGIEVLDHVILTQTDFYSMREHND